MMDGQEIRVNVDDDDSQNSTSSVQRRLAIIIITIPRSQPARSLSLVLIEDLMSKDHATFPANNNESMVQKCFLLSLRSQLVFSTRIMAVSSIKVKGSIISLDSDHRA